MNKFCVIANSDKEKALLLANQICSYLQDRNCVCVDATKNCVTDLNKGYADVGKIPANTECIIILGGDGTIIHAASSIAKLDIPILGVNVGNLGYLTDVEAHDVFDALDKLICDKYNISERLMIKGIVMRDKEILHEGRVLNDIVVGRDGFSRIIGLNVFINGELMETMRGDGVIISTPTGSTGYNLSAGGPVIKPDTKAMVITPICSHSLSSKSVVVSEDDIVTIEIIESRKTQELEAIASFDGSHGARMAKGDIIKICASHYTTKMINTGSYGYFEVLQKKLR